MKRLRVGETAEISYRDQNQIDTLRQAGRNLGILISVNLAEEKSIKIRRICEDWLTRISDIESINRGQLAELYSDQNLPPAVIGEKLGFSAELIGQALDFYRIPRRFPGKKYSGKYTSVFKTLNIGETVEVECAAKYPRHSLHSSAVRLGIKISTRKIIEGHYKITRVQ